MLGPVVHTPDLSLDAKQAFRNTVVCPKKKWFGSTSEYRKICYNFRGRSLLTQQDHPPNEPFNYEGDPMGRLYVIPGFLRKQE